MSDDGPAADRTGEAIWLPAPVGEARVNIIEMDYDDLPLTPRGRSGMRLSRLVDEIGGYEGCLVHPFTDEEIPVNVNHLRGRDPETTWVYVAFIDDVSEPED
jgi:hypothetical protein